MTENSTSFLELIKGEKLTMSAALHIVHQIAEQILLSNGVKEPKENDEFLFFDIHISEGSITNWSETISRWNGDGGCSKDYLRPFVKLALKLLPGPYEKPFLIKGVTATVESTDASLHTIVLGLEQAAEQAGLLERAGEHFDKGVLYEDNKKYADAVVQYQSAIELWPNGLAPLRALLYGRISRCFFREKLWADASIEAKKTIDTVDSIEGHCPAEQKEMVREMAWGVRIQALVELGDLSMATEAYIAALRSNIQLDITLTRPIVLEPSSLLQIIWSNSTVANILSIVRQESLRLDSSTSDDSETFLPGDIGSTVQFLSRLEKGPNGEIDWSSNRKPGFWFMSQVLITLLSLASIPQHYSYCPFGKAQLREILYVRPQKAFQTALRLKTEASTGKIARSVIKIIETAETSLNQTAQYHLSNSTWGKNTALIYQIAFQVAKEGSTIKMQDNATLLSSIYVFVDGVTDYSKVRVTDSESGMTQQEIQGCVKQLLTTQSQLPFPRKYFDAIFSRGLSKLKALMDEQEGRSVFELWLCSFALLHSQSFVLDNDDKEGMKMVQMLLRIMPTNGSSIFRDPDISALIKRLTSLPINRAVDNEIASLIGAIAVLVFKEEAQGS